MDRVEGSLDHKNTGGYHKPVSEARLQMKRLSSATNASGLQKIREDTNESMQSATGDIETKRSPRLREGSLKNLREQVYKPGSVPSA